MISLLVCACLALGGPYYLGQRPPGDRPELFAPGLANTGLPTRDIAMTPDGSRIYLGVFLPGFRKAVILETVLADGRWSAPEVALFSRDPRWKCLEPCISPDGSRFLFVTDRPEDPAASKPGRFGIWSMRREGDGWSEPRRLPAAVNGDANAFYPSLARNGDLYFLREEGQGGWVMRAAWKDGAWKAAEKLPAPFNQDPRQANPRIDPEGRWLLLPMLGRPDSLGGADYYGYFRKEDGGWVGPVHLGPAVNSEAGDEYSICPSPDGKVVFFGSNRLAEPDPPGPLRWRDLLATRTRPGAGSTALWWVDAAFLEEVRRKALAAGP